MQHKTISLPDDVVSIIDTLDMPFSRWVADHLRRHAAQSTRTFAQQLAADAELARDDASNARRLTRADARAVGQRMSRSAPW